MAILIILISPAMNMLFINLSYNNFNVYRLRDLVNFLPSDILSMPDKLYGFPLDRYRVALMLLWILSMVLVISLEWLRKRIKLKTIICSILACLILINVFLYIDRGSVLIMVDHPDSAMESVYKYYSHNPAKQESADFTVRTYDANLDIDHKLSATVKMTIDEKEPQDNYLFTLYHNYKIKKVYDATGKKLSYTQDGDYFDVKNPTPGKALKQIIVEYSGFSEAFYSNSKAAFLPGFFAYYPQPGYHLIYDIDDSYRYIDDHKSSNTSEFKIVIDSKLKLYSNLHGENNCFEGNAQNVTLMGGFAQEVKKGEQDYILMPLDNELSQLMDRFHSQEFQDEMEKAKKILGESDDLNINNKKIINIPYSLEFYSSAIGIYL